MLTGRRSQQPHHTFAHLSGSATKPVATLQHSWQDAGTSAWGAQRSAPASARHTQPQSHSRPGSTYPHSQAWAPPSSSSRTTIQHQPHNATASSSTTPSLTPDAALREHGNPESRFVPVPSETQVDDYLIAHMGQPDGLSAGYSVQGYHLDVYLLFVTVVQMGGSSSVSPPSAQV